MVPAAFPRQFLPLPTTQAPRIVCADVVPCGKGLRIEQTLQIWFLLFVLYELLSFRREEHFPKLSFRHFWGCSSRLDDLQSSSMWSHWG